MTQPVDGDGGTGLPEDLRGKKQLAADDKFCFECHSELPCFKRCCSDINILLTPLDVLRLARRLEISTSEFLDQYTMTPITRELHLPVIMLKMGDGTEKNCQLLGEQGCSVYEDRPWSCRMYPVGMGLPPARAGQEQKPYHFLVEDDFCEGHSESKEWDVASWSDDQGLAERQALEDGFQEIVSHPWFIGGRALDPKRMQMFHMTCYDLDSFRRFIFDSSFLNRFEVDEEEVEEMRKDDVALLKFGFKWLRYGLFGEPVFKARPDPAEGS